MAFGGILGSHTPYIFSNKFLDGPKLWFQYAKIKGLAKRRKNSKPVSRVLYPIKIYRASIIYLESWSPMTSSDLPPSTFQWKTKRATLRKSIEVYMVLQSERRTAKTVTCLTGELLPHLFTLTPIEIGAVILCYATILSQISSYSQVRCSTLPRLSSPVDRQKR